MPATERKRPPSADRPMRDLLLELPLLKVMAANEVDYAGTDPALLTQLVENAEQTTATIHKGLWAIGHLLACSAPEVETRDIPADVVEALGWFMAEMGDVAATAHALASAGRRYIFDYAPAKKKRIPRVRI